MSIAPAGTDEVAADLRPRIEAAGGRLEMDVSDLAREFGFPRISSRRVLLIAAALEAAGVRTDPGLTVEAVKVSLLVDGAARMPEPVAAPAEPEPPEPT